ncbi:putative protein tag-278 isoform X2 [Punica granatum]|uniref:Uncharacterized protein n=1 Tax=Punica granatum TaxID=22663 RepID=A0A6P8CWA1_PUNGR|nr:putative protein tag-278 isoform X2 [Punica granatum]
MELLKLSKFKLQLRALVSEARDLRERERSANEQLYILSQQKQKQTEEEYGRRVQELQAELASSDEIRRKLERQIGHLQDENVLLENKQKELNATIQGLVQSRDDFIYAYEESTCEMRRAIETRDRKLAMLSEKINSHLLLFDSIEKEALSVKQVVDNVKHVVSEKEELASSLRSKMDKVSAFEEVFIEKIRDLENKMRRDDGELQRKDRIISELEAQLEASKIGNKYQSRVEELQRTLSAKDEAVQNLLSEKKGLLFELGSLASVLQKVHDTFTNMNEKEKRKFASALGNQQGFYLVADERNGDPCEENDLLITGEGSPNGNCRRDAATNSESSISQKQKPIGDNFQENMSATCASEFARSPSQSAACFEPLGAGHAQSVSIHDGKESGNSLQHLESECSTARVENAEG